MYFRYKNIIYALSNTKASKKGDAMKRILVFAIVALGLLLASTSVMDPAKARIASISWLGSVYDWGRDDYYGTSVYGYEEGSEATLWVRVENDFGRGINVSEIIVGFDWDANYTTSLAPSVTMTVNEIRYFTVTFIVPNVTDVSNKYLHGYTVYVEHVNATGGLVGTMRRAYTTNPDFAVYSKDQMDAREMARLNDQLSPPIGGFNSTTAKLVWSQAANETNLADTLYAHGDFSDAKTHYSNALSLKDQAFIVEKSLTGGVQDAQLALIEAQAKSFEATANYLNGLSNMWVLIGIGVVLFAIGYIIRGFATLRKPSIVSA